MHYLNINKMLGYPIHRLLKMIDDLEIENQFPKGVSPMTSSSIGTSASHNNRTEDKVMGSRPTKCTSNLPIK